MASVCNGLERGLDSQPEIGLDCSGESTRSQPLDQCSVTRALALWLCRKEFPQRRKVVKQGKYLSRGEKKCSMCGWTHKQTQRESPWVTPLWHFEFYGAFLPSFLWPLILICLVHSPSLVYLRILPCVQCIS